MPRISARFKVTVLVRGRLLSAVVRGQKRTRLEYRIGRRTEGRRFKGPGGKTVASKIFVFKRLTEAVKWIKQFLILGNVLCDWAAPERQIRILRCRGKNLVLTHSVLRPRDAGNRKRLLSFWAWMNAGSPRDGMWDLKVISVIEPFYAADSVTPVAEIPRNRWPVVDPLGR